MSGLVLIVATADAERAHAALSIAAAAQAAGQEVRLYLHEQAVALLYGSERAGDPRRRAAGLPTLGDMVDEVLGLGVTVVACQSGLALCGVDAARLDPRIETGGLIGVMAALGDFRLAVV